MRRWALVAGVALAGACSTIPPRVGQAPPVVVSEKEEAAYQAVRAHYSEHPEIYQGFDTQLFSAATYQSAAFREARIRRQAEFLHWTPDVLARELAREQAENAQWVEFFFGAHTNDPHFDDFDSRNSNWRVVLVTGSGQVLPSEVVRIGRADMNMRAYYPYMSDFWVGYRIRFPRTLPDGSPTLQPGTQFVTLQVASTLGTARFRVPAQ
jgi:hypothetical protein